MPKVCKKYLTRNPVLETLLFANLANYIHFISVIFSMQYIFFIISGNILTMPYTQVNCRCISHFLQPLQPTFYKIEVKVTNKFTLSILEMVTSQYY